MGVRSALRGVRNVMRGLAAIAKDASASTITYKLDDPRLKKIFSRDDDSSLTDPYSQLSTFYACVNAKAAIAQVPFVIKKLGTDTVIESGGIVDLFAHPNPALSRFQLWEAIIISLENKGEWFIIKDREVGSDGVPAFLWPVDPSSMEPARLGAKTGPWVGWWIQRGGRRVFLDRAEVLFDKYLNPKDDIRGLAPMSAARLSAESSYDALRYNRNFFKNDATPSLVYSWKDILTDEQYRQERERLVDSRKGVQHAHRAALVDGGADIKQLGLSQRDMEFIQQFKLTRDDICMVTRVPKSMIAINEDVNYANALASRRGFWTDVEVPIMVRIEDKINSELLVPLGFEGYFDRQQIDALNWAWLEKIESGVKLIAMGFSLNQVNARLQLGFEEVPWGDEPRPQSPTLPAPTPTKAIPAAFTDAPVLRLTSDTEEKASRSRAWTEINGKASPMVVKCGQDIKGYFHDAAVKLFKKILKAQRAAVVKMGEIDPGILSDIFSDEELGKIVTQWTSLALETGAGTIVASTFDLADPQVLAAIQRHTSKVVEVNATVREKLQNVIRDTTAQSVAEGMTEQQTADLLVANIKEQLGEFDRHARTIARTEVHGAYSEGRYEGMKTTFPKAKKWISSRDAKVRDTHANLDGKVVPWDEAFANGLQYPLDPAGDATEVINCRCIMIPVYEGEKTLDMEPNENAEDSETDFAIVRDADGRLAGIRTKQTAPAHVINLRVNLPSSESIEGSFEIERDSDGRAKGMRAKGKTDGA